MSASREFFTIENTHAEFEERLRRAIFFGKASGYECPTCLDHHTHAAISAIADEYPHVQFETVVAARSEFAAQLNRTLTPRRAAELEATNAVIAKIAKRYGWT